MISEEKNFCYKYPHPALTADCVIFGFDGRALKVLLIERGLPPFKGSWALPGGFMRIDETVEQAAARELREETGLTGVYLEQFKAFSTVSRDPRERVVTVAFIALVRPEQYQLCAGDDATDAKWFDIEFLPPTAFDHGEIITQARHRLSEILRLKPIAFELLNKIFSLTELQRVYEAITGKNYDRRNFQRKALQSGILQPADTEPPCIMTEAAPEEYDECECAPEPPAAKGRPKRRSKPGRPSKFFSLFLKKDRDSDAEDASIKDLFNF
ncbi:MAG: NUDIX hydrolase [Prevotella sp.]|nr:NUDIX hydrolase [Prevotella sp.]MCM1075033.1 NUDIX hydrolase [Ruminococcus sp.]